MQQVILHIDSGKITNPKAAKKFFEELPTGKYLIEAKEVSKRSLKQNAWFHAILPEIVAGLRGQGFDEIKTPDDAKEVIKALFFKKQVTNGSETFEIIEPTSSQTKFNFAEKSEEIIRWASEYLGIDIAPPSSQKGLHFTDQFNQPGHL